MTTLSTLLGLATPPVAIAFCDTAPDGVARVAKPDPAACSYWRRAQAGEVFYTDAADQKGCPVGAHTHGVPLTDEDKAGLQGLIGTMVGLEYLTMAEIPQIPTRQGAFGVVVYGPLGKLAWLDAAADVIMVRGNVRQLMLLTEAANAAGVGGTTPTMGRPTCAVMPDAINTKRAGASFGCIGNRVYTGLGDGEGYFAIPGDKLAAVEARLAIVVRANQELEKFHQARV